MIRRIIIVVLWSFTTAVAFIGSISSIIALGFVLRDRKDVDVDFIPGINFDFLEKYAIIQSIQNNLPSVLFFLFIGLAFIFSILVSYAIWEINEKLRKVRLFAKTLNDTTHSKQLLLSKMQMLADENYTPADVEDIRTSLRILLHHIAQLFTAYTGDICSVSVKLCDADEHDNTIMIKTVIRDSKAYERRKGIPNLPAGGYAAEENAAYKHILTNEAHFLVNDLRKGKTYHSYVDDWNKYYNSRLCVSISPEDFPNRDNTIGFLSVDNFLGGFDENFALPMLMSYGKELHYVFSTYYGILVSR